MQRLLIVLLFVFHYNAIATAQNVGVVHFEATIESTYFWPNQQVAITTGYESTIWLSTIIGINSKFKMGYDTHHGLTFLGGWGQTLSTITIIELPGVGGILLGVLGIFGAVIPAGVTFALNPNDEKVVVMPYLHFLEMQYFQHDPKTPYRCSGTAGLKLHIKLKNGMAICPRLGFKYIYGKQLSGVELGIGVNLLDSENH